MKMTDFNLYDPPYGTDYLSTLPLEEAAELIQEDYELHFDSEFLNNDCPKDILDKLKTGILLTNPEVETLFELDRKSLDEWCEKLDEESRMER